MPSHKFSSCASTTYLMTNTEKLSIPCSKISELLLPISLFLNSPKHSRALMITKINAVLPGVKVSQAIPTLISHSNSHRLDLPSPGQYSGHVAFIPIRNTITWARPCDTVAVCCNDALVIFFYHTDFPSSSHKQHCAAHRGSNFPFCLQERSGFFTW